MHTLRLLWAAHNETTQLSRQKRYRSRQRLQNIDEMSEELFIERFGLSKAVYKQLCYDLRTNTALKGSSEIPLEIKVLCTLSFLATGSPQKIVGVTYNLSHRTASRCIRDVVDAINHNNIIAKWIVFPQTVQERCQIEEEFRKKYNLPGVIGCIDCTHIPIVKPTDDPHSFYNSKEYYSLNVQMVCNHNLEIVNVNSKFGGATHNAYIWSTSQLEPYMRGLHENGERVWLLGDSDYPQLPWLMTPITNAANRSKESLYTSRHSQARNCIEQCFSLLKSRWRCLLKYQPLHYKPIVASKITLACCVLHNIAVKAQLPAPSDVSTGIQNDDNDDCDFQLTDTSEDEDRAESIQGRAMLRNLISGL